MATTTQSTMLPQWYQDYLATAANRGLNLANMPFQAYGGQMVAPLSQTQNAGINMIQQRATSGSPLMRSAQQQMQDTIGGKYLNNNPYLDAVLNRSLGDVQARMGQLGVGSGSFGNSGVAAIQAREMADSANQIRYQNYDAERQRQLGAAGAAPGMAQADYYDANQLMNAGGLQRGVNQDINQANYNEFLRGQQWPFQTQNAFVGSLGMQPGSTSSTTMPDPSKWSQILGGGATALWGLGQLPAAASGLQSIWNMF